MIDFENPNNDGKWPCYFFQSDTTGEKDYEEFFTSKENIDLDRYKNIGVVESKLEFDDDILQYFLLKVDEMKRKKAWKKEEIVDLFNKMIPTFKHYETNKYLDDKM